MNAQASSGHRMAWVAGRSSRLLVTRQLYRTSDEDWPGRRHRPDALIGYGHDEVTVRSGLVALEQGKQFRAQAIPARCGKRVHGEKGDHDSETPWTSDDRRNNDLPHRASDTFAAWSADPTQTLRFMTPKSRTGSRQPVTTCAGTQCRFDAKARIGVHRPFALRSFEEVARTPAPFRANPRKGPDVNINAMWALYSSNIPPIRINQANGKTVALHQEQSNEVKERKSVEINSDLRGAKILRITNEIARSS